VGGSGRVVWAGTGVVAGRRGSADGDEPIAYTVVECAQALGVSVDTIYRAVRAGTLPVVQLMPRGKMFIPARAVSELFGSHSP
jgi:excisionase family DNA binding protein